MGYSLGIDLGAATCAAGVRRGAAVEPCVLGDAGTTMPAVALPRADGTAVVGEPADRRSPYEPTLVARMVAERLGEREPIVVDGVVCDPLELTRAILATAVARAAQSAGAPPDQVVLSYPLRTGDGPELLFTEAARTLTGGVTTMVPEPIAAVAKLAHDRDLGPDSIVAVVDFGGSSVDVTLVRRTPSTFDLVGDPGRLPELGGVDLDAAVLTLVEGAIGDVTSRVSPDDHTGMVALRRMRSSCREAKERLSTEHAAVVEVALAHARGRVEITREAFERAVEGDLSRAADLVLSTIEGAGLTPADVRVALLTGGSARIPRFVQLVAERTGLSVVADPAPELTVALGTVLFADVDEATAPGPALAPAHDPNPFQDPGARPGLNPAHDPNPFHDLAPLPAPTAGATAVPLDDPTTVTGPASPPELTSGEWTADDPWELTPAAEWHEPGPRWDDPRTSVFDPAPPPAPVLPATSPTSDWGQSGDEEFQRLTTSDTDPFGTRAGSLSSRLRDRRDDRDREGWDDDWDGDDGGATSFDARLLIGGVAAAILIVAIGAYALISGNGGGDDPALAVADSALTTTSSTSTSTTTTTVPPTTQATTTTTEPTTTTEDEPWRPPPTNPPTTAPPPTTTTTRPPTTTTRPPTTTTTTPPTTAPPTTPPTTACTPPPACP